jgi:hypothetical protein
MIINTSDILWSTFELLQFKLQDFAALRYRDNIYKFSSYLK